MMSVAFVVFAGDTNGYLLDAGVFMQRELHMISVFVF